MRFLKWSFLHTLLCLFYNLFFRSLTDPPHLLYFKCENFVKLSPFSHCCQARLENNEPYRANWLNSRVLFNDRYVFMLMYIQVTWFCRENFISWKEKRRTFIEILFLLDPSNHTTLNFSISWKKLSFFWLSFGNTKNC